MSRIQKLEVSFNPIEDRLILKFYTESLVEYRLYITRRFLKIFWKALQRLLTTDVKPKVEQVKEVKKIKQAYEKEQTMKKSDFVQKYSSKVQISKTPLGTDPILVSRIQIRQAQSGPPILCLQPENGRGFEIAAHTMIVRAICKLICEALKKTDWDLDFEFDDNEKMPKEHTAPFVEPSAEPLVEPFSQDPKMLSDGPSAEPPIDPPLDRPLDPPLGQS